MLNKINEETRQLAFELTDIKARLHQAGLYCTARMVEIAIQEIGWEMQGADTPPEQKKRQLETFDPNQVKMN